MVGPVTNGNHADQATDASQPQIYNGTAVITENGKASIYWSGTKILNCGDFFYFNGRAIIFCSKIGK